MHARNRGDQRESEAETGSMDERSHNKRMQGTLQPYLSSVAGVGFVASPNINNWLKGRP